MKSWLEKNTIEVYTTRNDGKSVAAERFIRTLKNKIDKYMTSISQNVYIDKLGNIVNKYNSTYHRTIKMKPVDVNPIMYIWNIGYVPNWSEEIFVIKKVKNTVSWTYVIIDLHGK